MARHPTVESEIRHRIDEWVEAIRAMDLDRVMSIYAPDIVSFDVEPPLRHVGARAKRRPRSHSSGKGIVRLSTFL